MAGIFVIGKYKPQRKSIGNLKKFDKVCASNTSLTDTATNNPRNADVSAIKNTLRKTINQSIPLSEEAQNNAKTTGTIAFSIPKTIAPVVFAIIKRFKLIGAIKSLSNDLLFFSNVIVTASIDVVPKSTDIAIIPGSISRISIGVSDLNKNISVHDIGNIIPQLILGGFR